jgi:hypothetical protein
VGTKVVVPDDMWTAGIVDVEVEKGVEMGPPSCALMVGLDRCLLWADMNVGVEVEVGVEEEEEEEVEVAVVNLDRALATRLDWSDSCRMATEVEAGMRRKFD